MSKQAKGKDLIFISRIRRDGSGVEMVEEQVVAQDLSQNETFEINCLSITNGTYIASGFNSYVVKLKGKDDAVS